MTTVFLDDLAQVNDVIGFVQPLCIGLANSRLQPRQMRLDGFGSSALYLVGPDPPVRKCYEVGPLRFERHVEFEADHNVCEIP